MKITETTTADDISGWNVFNFIIVDAMQSQHQVTVADIHHDAVIIEDKLDTVDVEKDPRRLIRINAGTVEFFYSRIGSGNGGDIA